jgi:hypothetical protein
MLRTALGALIGAALGALLAAGLLWLAQVAVRRWMPPPQMRMEHSVIYTSVVLGAGFGAVCGALAGLASALARALRQRPSPPPSGEG